MSTRTGNLQLKQSMRKVRFEDDNDTKCKSKSVRFGQHPKCVITPIRDEKKVHGTNYVNGTLNFSQIDYATLQSNNVQTSTLKKETKSTTPIIFRNQFTNDGSAKIVRKNCSIDQQYWENAVHRRGILLHVSSENQQPNNITFRTSRIRRYTSIIMGPSKYFKRSQNQLFNYPKKKTSPNTLELPTQIVNQPVIKTNPKNQPIENPFEKFSYKLIPSKSTAEKRPDTNLHVSQQSNFDTRALSIVRSAFINQQTELPQHCTSENLSEILQLAHRWQSTAQSMPESDNVSTRESSHSVEFCTLKKLDVKM